MNTTLESMLAYQKVDLELRAIEVELEQNEAFRTGAKARQNVLVSKEKLNQCDKKAEDILNTLVRIQSEYDAVTKKIAELKKDVEESDADDDVEYIIGVLKRTQESAGNLEREAEDLQRQIAELTHVYNDAREVLKKNKAVFETKKEEYDRFFSSKKSAMDALKRRLDEMAKGIDGAAMAKYAALRREKKVPVLVPIMKEGAAYRCPRCRMEVDAATVDNIRRSGAGECNTCHHILYMD